MFMEVLGDGMQGNCANEVTSSSRPGFNAKVLKLHGQKICVLEILEI